MSAIWIVAQNLRLKMPGKDRLAEFQTASKQLDLEAAEEDRAEEMKPLKKKDKNLSSSQDNFFVTLSEIATNIETVSFLHLEILKNNLNLHILNVKYF